MSTGPLGGDDIPSRLDRIERLLFIDGVARVEDGPFAPKAIMDIIKLGAEAEIEAEQTAHAADQGSQVSADRGAEIEQDYGADFDKVAE